MPKGQARKKNDFAYQESRRPCSTKLIVPRITDMDVKKTSEQPSGGFLYACNGAASLPDDVNVGCVAKSLHLFFRLASMMCVSTPMCGSCCQKYVLTSGRYQYVKKVKQRWRVPGTGARVIYLGSKFNQLKRTHVECLSTKSNKRPSLWSAVDTSFLKFGTWSD